MGGYVKCSGRELKVVINGRRRRAALGVGGGGAADAARRGSPALMLRYMARE